VQDRRASSEYLEAKWLLGALANSRGRRPEELLASVDGYTRRATTPYPFG
jgi:hypothetical protein